MSQSTESIEPIAHITRSNPTPVVKPTVRQWLLHLGLFLITGFTTTICGVLMAGPDLGAWNMTPPRNAGFAGSLLMIPWLYVATVARLVRFTLMHPYFLGQGLLFSGSLLAILVAHESGHYLFCRYYSVDATLPFFIPQPPLLIPGTFGAFIRMKSPVPSRRALFDIGLAGPLAGLVVIALISVLGWTWHGSPSGFLYVVLLAVMLRVRHPQPEQMEPLGLARTLIGILTLIVFVLCFLPFPITIT